MKEERRVRCAVVGLGQGLDDVNVIVHHPRLELAAICDSAPERYDWLTGRARIEDSDHELARNQAYRELIQDLRERPEVADAAYHQDYRELLRQHDVDSVSIVVGDPLHEAFTTAALAAGKYALCTKPMALTMESAWNIASAAREHPGRYMLALQMGYSPLVRTISKIVEDGELGRLRQLGFQYHRQPWRPVHSFRNAAIDGVFLKEGVHWFDMIYRICGMRPFRSVAAFGGIDGPPGSTDFEDNGVVIIDYGDFRATHGFSYFRRCRRPEELIIAGDGGTLRGTFSELDLENGAGQRHISIPGARLPRQRLVGYEDMYDAFAAMVLDGQEPYSGWQTALENMLTAYAAQLAISRNGLVTRRELAEFDWRDAAVDAHH